MDIKFNNRNEILRIPGGGSANTAKALSRLGIPTQFIGGISSDQFGHQILGDLCQNEVDVTHVVRSHLPTATATISLDSFGVASYEFCLANTASFALSDLDLPAGKPAVLYVGSLATLIEPCASSLLKWAKSISTPLVFDPNVRPSVLGDVNKYRSSVERWIEISNVVKMSKEDFDWLYPSLSSPSELLGHGPSLVVVTDGSNGMEGFYHHGSIFIPSIEVDVVDTVGAGDTVGAILVEAIFYAGLDASVLNLESVLSRAAKAAAITCSRAGAQPPTIAELANF